MAASLAKEHVEGQVCVTTDMFRSTVSRLWPSSSAIALSVCPGMPPLTAILPWNNRELFGNGGKINTPSGDYPPAILGPLDVLCVQSIKDPSEMTA